MDKVCEACKSLKSSKNVFYHRNIYSKILLNQQDDHAECTKALIKLGADVNADCLSITSVLARAAEQGHVKRLQALITAGADVNLMYESNRFEQHFNALTNAISGGNTECVELLIKAGASVTELPGNEAILNPAVRRDDTACVQLLVKAGASLNYPDVAPLHVAVRHKAVKCLDLLLKSGADVNAIDYVRSTSLMQVTDVECCRLLLIHGAKINMRGIDGYNAVTSHMLHSTCINKDICFLLFLAGETSPKTVKSRYNNKTIKVVNYLPQIQIKFNLKHLCREVIRKHLIDLDPHTHLFGRIPRLGLPKSLTEYLLYYKSLDSDDNDDSQH